MDNLRGVKGGEAMEMFKLVKANNLLPQKVEELVPISFIGSAAVRYYRDIISLMDQLGVTEAQRKATLRDGQDAGELLLDIEARIGELLPDKEEAQRLGRKVGKIPGVSKVLPEGINHHRANQARSIARHPDIVEQVKAQARENEDIPTKTAVLNAINYEKEKARKETAEKGRVESRSIATLDQIAYLNALDKCLLALPQRPPKKWGEETFKEAQAKAKIIIKRLEVFNGQES